MAMGAEPVVPPNVTGIPRPEQRENCRSVRGTLVRPLDSVTVATWRGTFRPTTIEPR